MSLPKVYVLILNWNNWKDTIVSVENALGSSYPDFQVVLIDNGSTDGSEEKFAEWAEGKLTVELGSSDTSPVDKPISFIKYNKDTAEKGGQKESEQALYSSLKSMRHPIIMIQTGADLGYAAGNNVGICYALAKGDASYIWILGNDTAAHSEALSEMVNSARADSAIGMVGSKLLYYDRPNVLQAAGGCRLVPWVGNTQLIATNEEDDGRWDTPLEPDYISGASLLATTGAIRGIGLIEERYFLYWEDADWGVRARKAGYKLVYCPKSRVRHKEGGTTGYMSPAVDYYWVRNGLYFMKRFYPWFLPVAPLAYLAKHTIIRGLRGQPLNFGAFLRGISDFLTCKTGEGRGY